MLGQGMGSFSLLHFKRHLLHFCARFFTKVLFLLIFVAIIPPQACLTVPLLYLCSRCEKDQSSAKLLNKQPRMRNLSDFISCSVFLSCICVEKGSEH